MAYETRETESEIDFGETNLKTRIIMAFKMLTGQKIKVRRKVKIIQ